MLARRSIRPPPEDTMRDTIFLFAFALATLLTVAAPRSAGASDHDERIFAAVYLTNWSSNSVSRLDLFVDGSLALREVVGAPQGSGNALGAALSPDRRSLYVAQWGSGSLSRFQVERGGRLAAVGTVPASLPVPTDSAQVVVSPDGLRAYMTNFNGGAGGTLSVYDLNGGPRALATIPTGGDGAAGAAISADGRTLYVAHMTSGDVTAFRIASRRLPTPLGSCLRATARLWWSCRRTDGDCGPQTPSPTTSRHSSSRRTVGCH